MSYAPHLLPKVRSERLMESIRGMPCTLRISSFVPGHKCASRETVVGCHLPTIGKGTRTKVTDLAVVAACFHCHNLLDRVDLRIDYIEMKFPAALAGRMLDALVETHAMLVSAGIITVADSEII